MNECLQATTDKMVGENKAEKGKEHGLSYGINRNSTHEYGKKQHSYQCNLNSELKVKKNREMRKKVRFERREKVEFIS